ncbi:hypothetical protein CR513_41608, partial [Mucuna pruriens]
MLCKVEINIPLFDAIKDPRIFSVPCTIGECTFADAILDLGASINVMPMLIYKALNFGDLEPTGMTIQLANRSIVQPLGALEDVLVQVNELIFLGDFYVLHMEDETSGKGSTLILGRLFLMTAKTKIDVHVGTLSMEFGDTLVQFNIFEAMKHTTEDYSLFGIDLIDELVEKYLQLDSRSEDNENFAGDTNVINCLGSTTKADYEELAKRGQDEEKTRVNSAEQSRDKADMLAETISANEDQKRARTKLTVPSESVLKDAQRPKTDSNTTKIEDTERSRPQQPKAEITSAQLVPSSTQTGQSDLKIVRENSSSPPPPLELKPLSNHLKYAYLDNEHQFPVIIANNLHQEQEDRLLNILRKHKKEIRWKLSDLPSINPSIYMH